jgi:ribosomal-protein-alanine N-acetyltransferase
MSDVVEYCSGRASKAEIAAHLRICDDSFFPPLSSRVDIDGYAHKIIDKAQRYEAWVKGELAGLVAAYCNSPDQGAAFITSVSVLPSWQGKGIASRLMKDCIRKVRELGFSRIVLEVHASNFSAVLLYRKNGFTATSELELFLRMKLDF